MVAASVLLSSVLPLLWFIAMQMIYKPMEILWMMAVLFSSSLVLGAVLLWVLLEFRQNYRDNMRQCSNIDVSDLPNLDDELRTKQTIMPMNELSAKSALSSVIELNATLAQLKSPDLFVSERKIEKKLRRMHAEGLSGSDTLKAQWLTLTTIYSDTLDSLNGFAESHLSSEVLSTHEAFARGGDSYQSSISSSAATASASASSASASAAVDDSGSVHQSLAESDVSSAIALEGSEKKKKRRRSSSSAAASALLLGGTSQSSTALLTEASVSPNNGPMDGAVAFEEAAPTSISDAGGLLGSWGGAVLSYLSGDDDASSAAASSSSGKKRSSKKKKKSKSGKRRSSKLEAIPLLSSELEETVIPEDYSMSASELSMMEGEREEMPLLMEDDDTNTKSSKKKKKKKSSKKKKKRKQNDNVSMAIEVISEALEGPMKRFRKQYKKYRKMYKQFAPFIVPMMLELPTTVVGMAVAYLPNQIVERITDTIRDLTALMKWLHWMGLLSVSVAMYSAGFLQRTLELINSEDDSYQELFKDDSRILSTTVSSMNSSSPYKLNMIEYLMGLMMVCFMHGIMFIRDPDDPNPKAKSSESSLSSKKKKQIEYDDEESAPLISSSAMVEKSEEKSGYIAAQFGGLAGNIIIIDGRQDLAKNSVYLFRWAMFALCLSVTRWLIYKTDRGLAGWLLCLSSVMCYILRHNGQIKTLVRDLQTKQIGGKKLIMHDEVNLAGCLTSMMYAFWLSVLVPLFGYYLQTPTTEYNEILTLTAMMNGLSEGKQLGSMIICCLGLHWLRLLIKYRKSIVSMRIVRETMMNTSILILSGLIHVWILYLVFVMRKLDLLTGLVLFLVHGSMTMNMIEYSENVRFIPLVNLVIALCVFSVRMLKLNVVIFLMKWQCKSNDGGSLQDGCNEVANQFGDNTALCITFILAGPILIQAIKLVIYCFGSTMAVLTRVFRFSVIFS